MAVAQLGTLGANNHKEHRAFVKGSAETITESWNGERVDMVAKYNELKELGYSNVDLDVDNGRCSVVVTEVFDPNTETLDNKSYWSYSLVPVEVSRAIEDHPYFLVGGTITGMGATGDPITPTNILKCRNTLEKLQAEETTLEALKLIAPWNGAAGTEGYKMLELLAYWSSGRTEYPSSEFILRETKEVSLESLDRADYTSANRVATPPSTSTVNDLIGNLPNGEWLKRYPQVERISKTRWQIVTEWWWALKWAKIPYGGSFDPYAGIA